ncbi:MAG TPA: 4'-phosphopantetheinyl transferase superfamily protein [Pseudolabrys sp.]|nr:4'-phosphopantetheinyl transferase superfamily protein [Pseudolabrys sp.]
MPADVDVYVIDLDRHDVDPERLLALLGDEEIERAQRFRTHTDRRRYVARHAGLRVLLARYLSVPPPSLSFCTNAFGKPFLAGGDLHFSLSHSAGAALVAIARGRELGCDMERRDPAFPALDVAEAFFSPFESRCLRELDASLQLEAFFNCWTRKEAYIKARGCGLSIPLDSFDVSLAPGEPARLLSGCAGWSVQSFEPMTGFHAAVVAQSADWRLDIRAFDLAAAIAASPNGAPDHGVHPTSSVWMRCRSRAAPFERPLV